MAAANRFTKVPGTHQLWQALDGCTQQLVHMVQHACLPANLLAVVWLWPKHESPAACSEYHMQWQQRGPGTAAAEPSGRGNLQGFAQPSASPELDPAELAERPLCGQFQSSGQCARGQRCPLVHGLLCQVGFPFVIVAQCCSQTDCNVCSRSPNLSQAESLGNAVLSKPLLSAAESLRVTLLVLHGKTASRCR